MFSSPLYLHISKQYHKSQYEEMKKPLFENLFIRKVLLEDNLLERSQWEATTDMKGIGGVLWRARGNRWQPQGWYRPK